MKTKTTVIALGVLLVIFIFASCANQASVLSTNPYGFWSGLWHGVVTPVSFIGSLFSDSIAVYACDNSGGLYDFGFLIGIGGLGFTFS
jgi:hypothetical protein|tara:strand:+ start:1830 stop:2093 length:264 start_codon:yes stop_codon:yes gene_type:complete